MTSLVACFSGRIGSGKTSVSRAVAEALGAAWTGFGDFVRATATARSLDASSREVLQDLGAQLIREHGSAWLCEQVIARAGWDGLQPLVIDGVRHVDVLDEIARQLAAHRTVLIHLDFDGTGELRGLDAASRRLAELHATEQDVLRALPARANIVVSTNPPLESVVRAVLEFLRPLAARPR